MSPHYNNNKIKRINGILNTRGFAKGIAERECMEILLKTTLYDLRFVSYTDLQSIVGSRHST